MERVETLYNMLSEKMQQNASIAELLATVRMMESELVHLQNIEEPNTCIENQIASFKIAKKNVPLPLEQMEIAEEPKTVEILEVDEDAINAELEEIKHNLESNNSAALRTKPVFTIDEEPEVEIEKNIEINTAIETPKELNEVILVESFAMINDEHKGSKNEIIDALKVAPIVDLKKAIGVNERFLYLNELFRGDESMYDKSIKTINAFANYNEAELWMKRELLLRLGWNENYNTVKQFYALVKRRFS